MTGLTGRLFTEFAWTLAGAVIVSGFVALTLSPMMCSKLLRHQEQHNLFYRIIERFLNGITAGYRALLKGALAVRPLVLLIGLARGGRRAISSSTTIKSELAPVEDQGNIIAVFRGPEGATIEYTDAYAKKLEEIALDVPEADRVFVGRRQSDRLAGRVILRIKPWGERERTQQEIATLDRAADGRRARASWRFRATRRSLGQSARSKPINFVIQTSQALR